MAEAVQKGRRRLLAIIASALAGIETAPAFAARLFQSRARSSMHNKTWSAEAAALVHLREQRFDEAIALLEAAVDRELVYKHGSVSLRLLDLLATLHARKGRLEKLLALAGRVQATAESRPLVRHIATAMLDRAGNWRNENSKWRRDRANPQAIIKWCWTKRETGGGTGKHVQRDDIVITV